MLASLEMYLQKSAKKKIRPKVIFLYTHFTEEGAVMAKPYDLPLYVIMKIMALPKMIF